MSADDKLIEQILGLCDSFAALTLSFADREDEGMPAEAPTARVPLPCLEQALNAVPA